MKPKNLFTILAALAMLTSSACTDATAAAYAKTLLDMLDGLIAQAGQKLADEQKRTLDEAHAFVAGKNQDAISTLRIARTTASTRTVLNQMLEGKANGAQVLNGLLPDYGEFDFATTQRIYEQRADEHIRALENLHNLNLDVARLQALRAAVEALTATPMLLDQGGQYAQYAGDVKANVDFHTCVSLSETIAGLDADVAAAEKQIKVVGTTDAAELARLNNVLAALGATRKASAAKRVATGRFANGKSCAKP